jgi:uncharacterized membrane protein
MDAWTLIRYLHLLAMAFFVGGQLVLAVAIAPTLRGSDAMKPIARKFGIGSAVALAIIIATGAAMASHLDRWDDGVLQAKLGLLVVVFLLLAGHVVIPRRGALSAAIAVTSLVIAYLGVQLAHG